MGVVVPLLLGEPEDEALSEEVPLGEHEAVGVAGGVSELDQETLGDTLIVVFTEEGKAVGEAVGSLTSSESCVEPPLFWVPKMLPTKMVPTTKVPRAARVSIFLTLEQPQSLLGLTRTSPGLVAPVSTSSDIFLSWVTY